MIPILARLDNVFHQLHYLRPIIMKTIKPIAFMGVVTIAASLLSLLPPYLGKLIFDEGILPREFGKVVYYGFFALVIYLVASSLRFAAQVLFSVASNKFAFNLKGEVLNKIMHMPLDFYDNRKSGYLVSRVNEADSISGLFSPTIFQFGSGVIESIGAFIIVFGLSAQVTLIITLFIPPYYFITRWMRIRLGETSNNLLESSAKTMGGLQEVIQGVTDIKQTNAEGLKAREVIQQFEEVSDKRVKQSFVMAIGINLLGFLTSAVGVAIMISSGALISQGQLTIGDYVALSGYGLKILLPIQLFGNITVTLQPIFASLKRLNIILDSKTEQELYGQTQLDSCINTICYNNVGFKYEPDKPNILYNCNLQIGPHERVTILGRNGSGKSTLLKLLLGFYPGYSGDILINNAELRTYDIISLRKRIGIVSQNPCLFSGTLEENVRMANPTALPENIDRVLALSGCKEIFTHSQSQLRIDEFGKNLSGGQKQAISIARCLLKDPDVLIFDEATAHLDAISRSIVQNSIDTMFVDKIRIVITHDMNISIGSNKIYELEDGGLKEVKPI